MHKSLLLISFTILSFNLNAQKVDTTFYGRDGQEVTRGEEFLTYEVCDVDRKGRKDGICARLNNKGKLVETVQYEKDSREGFYYRYNILGAHLVKGYFEDDKKVKNWLTYDMYGNPSQISFYKNGELDYSRDLEFADDTTSRKFSKDDYREPMPDEVLKDLPDSVQEMVSKGELKLFVMGEKASFPGGNSEWMKFLSENLKYPQDAKRLKIQGAVFLKNLITKEGLVAETTVIKSPHKLLSEAAKNVMELSPKWFPAKHKGDEIDSYIEFRIVFKID